MAMARVNVLKVKVKANYSSLPNQSHMQSCDEDVVFWYS